jgi:Cu-Zn family superoxide dismutase
MKYVVFILGILFFFSGFYYANAEPKTAKAELLNSKGERVGVATFIEGKDGVRIALQVYNLPPGLHGFHIHAVGKCEQPNFKSAGGHFNPYEKHHGLKNPEGLHAGDMSNILVEPDGTATVVMLAPLVTLNSGKNSLFQSDGTALVVHAGADDQMSDPSGNSGDRIACGVITK